MSDYITVLSCSSIFSFSCMLWMAAFCELCLIIQYNTSHEVGLYAISHCGGDGVPLLFCMKWSIMAVSNDVSHSRVSGVPPLRSPTSSSGLRLCILPCRKCEPTKCSSHVFLLIFYQTRLPMQPVKPNLRELTVFLSASLHKLMTDLGLIFLSIVSLLRSYRPRAGLNF